MNGLVRFVLPVLLSFCWTGALFAQTVTHSRPFLKTSSTPKAAVEYTFVLPDPNAQGFLFPHAMNNLDEVTGQRYDGPFIYKNGTVMHLLGGSGYGNAINDTGNVVGMEHGETQAPQAFLYTGGDIGQVQYLNVGQANITGIEATGINNKDQIVGYFFTKASRYPQGFVYQNGITTFLTNVPYPQPVAINDSGEIAENGESGTFLYTHGFSLRIPPQTNPVMVVTGLDSSGRVTGYVSNLENTATSAFVYRAGQFTLIPNSPGVTRQYPGGMNACGEFVGSNDLGAFLYTHGAVKQLGYLLTRAPYNRFEPLGINDRGDIFGEVVINSTASTMIMVRAVPETCGTDATIVNAASSSTVGPGGKITYTIQASNLNAQTTQFTVSNALGRESRLLNCSVAGSVGSCTTSTDGRSVRINLPDLEKGAPATITLTTHIAGTSGDNQLVMDTATLSSSATADYLSTAYTNIRLDADLSVSASLVSNVDGSLHYLATVTDLGPNNSHAALLLDPLPANTSFVSASTTAGTCSFHPTIGPNGAVRCPLGNLAYAIPAQVDIVLQASPAACPSVTNTFSLTSQSIDSNSNNDSSTVVTPLSGAECISGMAKR